MSEVKQDIYQTNQSSADSINNIGQQITIDLKLNPSTNDLNGGTIKGVIKNISGTPINNAYIKLLSNTSEPLRHTISNENGNYILVGIPQGIYNIMVVGTGYSLKEQKNIEIINKQEIVMDFNLQEDPTQKNAIITGKVLEFSSGQALENCILTLYKLGSNNEKNIQAIGYSNAYGEFSFRNIVQGNYNILITLLGYNSTNIDVLITIPGQIVPLNMYIIKNQYTSRGTISGVILDKNTNEPVQKADVILYKVQEDSSLMPVGYTRTNENGIYLFINVPGGTYKVKSNALVITELTISDTLDRAPNFKSFTIETLGAFTPLEFYAKDGVLENDAIINLVTDYVTNLGGSNNGQVIVSLPAIEGPYELGFQYLASNNQQNLKLAINDEIINLTLPPTTNMEPSSSRNYFLTTNLSSGINSVKFFNDNGQVAPDINKITLKMLSYTKDYLAKDGTLYSGATVSTETGYVTNLGINSAYLELDVFAPIGGEYEFAIQYLSGSEDRTMSILVTDIYDSSTNRNLVFPKTDSFNVNDAKFITTTFTLVGGNNTIYFYNDQNLLCPDINIIRIKELFFNKSYNPSDVQLFNGAEIQNGLITNIVSGLGYMVLNADIYGTYSYNFIIEYLSQSGTNICRIDVNGEPVGDEYFFEITGNTPKEKIVPLILGAGQNIIKIYNSPKNIQ